MMNIKKAISLISIGTLSVGALYGQAKKPVPSEQAKMNTFVKQLMAKMTVEEKIGQLNLVTGGEATTGSVVSTDVESKIAKGQIGGIFSLTTPQRIRKTQEIAVTKSRLKIPMIFGQDVIHGYKTSFPIPLALAASWDLDMIKRTARIAATEATADGLNWAYSPMVDIVRDARWGRVAESSGEDEYLGSQIARVMVQGLQGDLKGNNTMMACVKHFALYGAAESGRDYNTTDMSLDRMYNVYFKPYKAAIDAGAGSAMVSFNDINGTPATANKWLLTDVLRKEWGFKGFVVSDYTGVSELIDHGLGDLQQVSSLALKAGTDMDMVSEGYLKTLKTSLQQKKISMANIDNACRLILEAKYKLGLFADPYKYCSEERAKTEILTPGNLRYSREAAAQTFVLLKNQNKTLPLKKAGTIAVIGPLGNTRSNMPGTWAVNADLANTPSLVEGLKAVAGNNVYITYSLGSNLTADATLQKNGTMFGREIPRDDRPEADVIEDAVKAAKQADVVVAALGEGSEMSGESSSRTDIGIPDVQKRLLAALLKTGKPVVLVLFTGRPLTIKWESENVPAILNVWFGGSQATNAIADVLFGDVNPSGKLPITFPQNVGQVPIYYSHKNTGRPLAKDGWFTKFKSGYLDVSNDPLYPFGFGLSYTTFNYSNIKLSATSFKPGGSITASVTITNTGSVEGKETVQLYTRDLVGSSTRPVMELKGFRKIDLKPGESKQVNFMIKEEDLKFYNAQLKYVAEPGDFKVFIGPNSADVKDSNFTLLSN